MNNQMILLTDNFKQIREAPSKDTACSSRILLIDALVFNANHEYIFWNSVCAKSKTGASLSPS